MSLQSTLNPSFVSGDGLSLPLVEPVRHPKRHDDDDDDDGDGDGDAHAC